MDKIDNAIRDSLSFLDNEYVNAGLSLFLILYAGMVAPKLPGYIVKAFDNYFVKLVMFFLIVYISRKDVTIAIISAVAVMVTLIALDRFKIAENMMNVERFSSEQEYVVVPTDNVTTEGSQYVDAVSKPVRAEQLDGIKEGSVRDAAPSMATSQEQKIINVSDEIIGSDPYVVTLEQESNDPSINVMNVPMVNMPEAGEINVALPEMMASGAGGTGATSEINLPAFGSVANSEAEIEFKAPNMLERNSSEEVVISILNSLGEFNGDVIREVMQMKDQEEALGNPVSAQKLKDMCRAVSERQAKQNVLNSSNAYNADTSYYAY